MAGKYSIPHINIILPGLAFLMAIILLSISGGPLVLKYFRDKNLLKSGIEANARVTALEDTGNRLNRNPQVRMKLSVAPEGQAPFQAELTAYISTVDLPNYQPGKEIRVKYNPRDPSSVALVPK